VWKKGESIEKIGVLIRKKERCCEPPSWSYTGSTCRSFLEETALAETAELPPPTQTSNPGVLNLSFLSSQISCMP
jgi:hypothetical protein